MKKRILSLLLAVMMILTLMPAAALADTTATSGKCGDNLTWELVDGTLTISGTGAMTDYDLDWNESPWYNSRASIHEIVISNSVTTIGCSAFYGCSSLMSVTIPDSVTEIGDGAFRWCSSLTSVTIPDSVTEIGWYVFSGCSNLASVTIPGGMTEIGYCAFEGCSNLTSVKISDGVEIICGDAFHDCNSLEYVSIPSSVETIEDAAFRLCSNLAEVDYAGSTEQWNAIDIGFCNDYLVKCYEGNRLVRGNIEWNIKDGTLFISGTGAMADYTYNSAPWYESKSNIKKVEISEGITSIGEYAFSECNNLIEIDIPDSVCAIGLAAFNYCTSLETVVLPEGIDNLNGYKYWVSGAHQSGPFLGCTSLKNITIPTGVKGIGVEAFCGCSSLTDVTIPDSVTMIGRGAFYGCSSLTDVYYSGTREQWNSISIDDSSEPLLNATIHYNSHIHSYTTTVIGPTCTDKGYTLYTCSCGDSYKDNYVAATGHNFISSVTDPTCTEKGYTTYTCSCGETYTADYVSALDHDTVIVNAKEATTESEGYTGDEVCTRCKAVIKTGTVIPKEYGPKDILQSGYCGAEGDGKNLSWELTMDGELTIRGTGVMKKYSESGDISPWNCNLYVSQLIVEDGVTTIGNYAFNYCDLGEVVLPDSVASIGHGAFKNCSFDSIVLPYGLKTIGNNAFENSDIKSIELPATLKYLGEYAFSGCTNLTGTIVVPEMITEIKEGVFCECYKLSEIVLHEGITSIGEAAFTHCINLQRIELPSGIKSIEAGTFSYCGTLSEIVIPDGVTSIGDSAFEGCTQLQNVVLPESVQSIGESAFAVCGNLRSIALPNGLKVISAGTFESCVGLETIVIPESVTEIGDSAFNNCKALESITIPVNVKTIGKNAFYECTALNSVSLPKSLKTVAASAFNKCSNIADVYYEGNEVMWKNIDFTSGNEAITGCPNIHYAGHTHTYSNPVFTAPTCEKQGYMTYSCECGATIDGEFVDALGHTFGDDHVCSVCGKIGDHQFVATIIDPTCTEKGYTSYECPCGEHYTDSYVSALDHSFVEGVCTACGAVDPYFAPEYEHDYENGICRDCFAIDPNYEHATSGYCGGEGDGTNLTWKLENNVLTISGNGAMQDYENNYFDQLIPWYAQRMTIEQLVIEEGVTTIGYDSFSEFYGMTSVVIPDGVTVIGGCAFWSCTNLEDVTIPDSVQTIGQRAFFNCQSLTEISIPVSVSTIEWDAFIGCDNLAKVYYGGTQEQWNRISIDESGNEALLYAEIVFTGTHTHTVEVVGYAEPTCTEDGYTGDEVCTVCREVVSTGETVEATGHVYGSDKVCDICGHQQSTSETISNWFNTAFEPIRNFFNKIFGRG